MMRLPSATAVGRRIPKEAFYKHLTLSKALKEKFVSDIESICAANSLTKDTLHLTADAKIKEILVLTVELKKKDAGAALFDAIAAQNPHKLLFLLRCGGEARLAVRVRKIYMTEWQDEENIELSAEGFSLDEIWENFVRRIALKEKDAAKGLPLEAALAREERLAALAKEIEKITAAMWKEKQPRKKLELHRKIRLCREELEQVRKGETNGQTENAQP